LHNCGAKVRFSYYPAKYARSFLPVPRCFAFRFAFALSSRDDTDPIGRVSVRDEYDKTIGESMYQVQEALQDSMLSLWKADAGHLESHGKDRAHRGHTYLYERLLSREPYEQRNPRAAGEVTAVHSTSTEKTDSIDRTDRNRENAGLAAGFFVRSPQIVPRRR